jgi:hypothetical protein
MTLIRSASRRRGLPRRASVARGSLLITIRHRHLNTLQQQQASYILLIK